MKISISQLKPGNLSGFSFTQVSTHTQFRAKQQNKAISSTLLKESRLKKSKIQPAAEKSLHVPNLKFYPSKPLPLKSQNSVSGTGLHKITLFVKK
jgi:hypothetical protein